MRKIRILFNGIPSSGKTTYAQKLHLALEHVGYETVLLDDEVIKRLDTIKVNNLVEYLGAPITIIASTDACIEADVKIWCDIGIREAEKRNRRKLDEENAPRLGSYDVWDGYQGQGIKVKNWEDVCREVNKTSLSF